MNLTFENISVSYRRKAILESLSFTVESGSITALIGRNGAGKSTLISCLTGEKQDYQGSILLQGKNIRTMGLHERSRNLACMPQILPRPHVTVRELVSFGRTPYTSITGGLSPTDREFVDWAMASTGMASFASAFVDELSGGERKKAFFAMTLAQDTPMVVLDEPTAHLDVVSRFEFLALLESIREKTEKTFLVVMHDLPEVLCCADRIVTIHQGTVVFNGSAADFLSEKIPQTCFHVNITGDPAHGYALRPL